MKQESIELARYRLEKARNTLLDAKQYLQGATLESTVNRIYYALFYAVNALLSRKDSPLPNIRELGLFSTKSL